MFFWLATLLDLFDYQISAAGFSMLNEVIENSSFFIKTCRSGCLSQAHEQDQKF